METQRLEFGTCHVLMSGMRAFLKAVRNSPNSEVHGGEGSGKFQTENVKLHLQKKFRVYSNVEKKKIPD